jgi:hypothetical protein
MRCSKAPSRNVIVNPLNEVVSGNQEDNFAGMRDGGTQLAAKFP